MSASVVSSGRIVAIPALLGAILSFQLGAVVAKGLFPLLGPLGTVGVRISFSAIMLCALWRPWRAWPDPAAWRLVALYGVSMGTMNTLFYLAIARLPLGPAVAIEFCGPLAVAFLGSRQPIDLLWAVMVVAGLMLLLDPAASLHHLDPLGVLFALGAGLFWAAYILIGHRVGRTLTGSLGPTLGLAIASLLIVPLSAPSMLPILHAPHLLAAALFTALLSSALPYSLEMLALRRMTTRGFGVLMSLDPAFAALCGLLFLGETLSAVRWLAIICIVLASIGSELSVRRGRRP